MTKIAAAIFIVWLFSTLSDAQAPAQKPAFEVASIKANTASYGFGTPISVAGGRFAANLISVSGLINWAYRSSTGTPFLRTQIIGLPSWATADHFDIQAKPEGESRDVPLEEMQVMVQRMLQDRFQLKSHRETREAPIYILTVAKPGRIKLSPDQSPTPPPTGPRAVLPPRLPRGRSVNVAFMNASRGIDGTMAGNAVPITDLVEMLQGQVERIVVDKTGLSGLFDFNVKYTPDGPGSPPTTDPQAPSIFTALQEELGLKLESSKGPVEVLVIDSVSKPTEN
jgi:uncharacterized protein (TIGR03435 family)